MSPFAPPEGLAVETVFAAPFHFVESAAVFVVLPVPPLATGSTPVTPGVMLAEPSKEAVDVLARFVLTVRAVASFVAVPAFPETVVCAGWT